MSFRIKPLAAAIALGLSSPLVLAELSSNASEFSAGDSVQLKYRARTTRSDTLFVAAVINGSKIYFVNAQGKAEAYVPASATPARQSGVTAGSELSVFDYQFAPSGDNQIDFYAFFAQSGGDVFANGMSAMDLTSLEHTKVRTRARSGAQPASGRVVDAAAAGAKVCVDKNFNKQCDADEAAATAGSDGRYTLNVSDADLGAHPVIAVTSAGYVLEAPVGAYQVISPLTTLVQNEIDVDRGAQVDRAMQMVGIEIGVDSMQLLADYSAGSSAEAQTARNVAGLVSAMWQRVAGETAMASETDARRRAAIAQYSRNLVYKKGWVLHEALAQAGQDPVAALAKFASIDTTVLGDSLRSGKLSMLAQQRYRPEWVTKPVASTYVDNPYFYLSYDATTQRLTVNGNKQSGGEVRKMDLALHPTHSLAALPSLAALTFTKVGGTYEVTPEGGLVVRGKNGGQGVEKLTTVDELDLGGKTIKLGELLGFSSSVLSIPEAWNIPVTFAAGDKMWREHHDKVAAPLASMTFSTRASGVASLAAYVASKNDELSPYATFADYAVYFKPADIASPANGGEVWAYNATTQSRFKVGRYFPKADGGRSYLVIEATTLKGVTGATPSSVIYFDAASSSIKYVSWRDYVMHCLCWMRKLNLSALQRIIDTLKTANSPLITPATTVSTAPTGHSQPKAVIPIALSTEVATLVKQAVCGGCIGGDCGACPVGDVVGLR